MTDSRLRTPVVLLIFNRPRATRRVVEAVAAARPRTLFVVADGPRPDHPADAALCAEARRVVEGIGGNLELVRDYSASNLGCGRRVASGITAVFEAVEEAIVLEDDCLPDPSFFGFCNDLLSRYRDDPRVMMISGTNDLIEWRPRDQGYHYSRYGSVWGWASWRRSWKHFDHEMRSWSLPEMRQRLAGSFNDPEQAMHRSAICNRAFRGEVDTWDYQWTYARLMHDGLAVVPSRNLVSNIGFDGNATHTAGRWDTAARIPRFTADTSLRPPPLVAADGAYDRFWFEWQVGRPSADALRTRAESLLAAGHNAQALLLLGRWKSSPAGQADHAGVLVLKARALAGLGNRARALEALTEALALRPGDAQALDLQHVLGAPA